jgi:PD-(D/E)XK nuclease superfamily
LENIVQPDFSQVLRQRDASETKQMLTVSFDDSVRAHIKLNSSSLSIIQTCPRKAFYLLHAGWRSKVVSSPLVFGSAIHKAMEVFYGTPRAERGELPPNFEDQAALIPYEPNFDLSHWAYRAVQAFVRAAEPLRMLPDTDKRSLSSGIWALGHYFRVYWNDIYVTACDEQGPIVERTFSVPFLEARDFDVELFGTIDTVLRNEASGEVLPGDHKTSSQMGSDFLNRIKPNHQYTGYLWGAKHALGLETENFLINGIQVKARPLTARGGPPTFTRQITKRTEQDFAEFRDVVDWACRSYLSWIKHEVWPLGPIDACSSWGGCQFLDICSAPNSLRSNILEAKFEEA